MRLSLLAVSSIALATLVVGCSSGDEGPAPMGAKDFGPTADVEVADGTEVLGEDLVNQADVGDGQVRFPPDACERLKRLPPGSVIMGDRAGDGTSTNNPDGFLGRVKAVECTKDGVVVKTDPATIPDAFEKLKLDWGLNIPACKDAKPSLGVSYGGTLFEESSVAKTADGKDVPFTASAGLDSSICLTPKLTLKADVKGLKLNSFEVSATGKLEAKVLVKVAVKLDPSVDAKTQAELAGKELKKSISKVIDDRSIPLGSIAAGDVKLPVSLKYTTTVSCDFSFTAPVEVEVGARAMATMTAGLTYESGRGLAPKTDRTAAFQPVPPTFKQDGMLRAVCVVNPKLQLKLFGLATGEIGAKAYGSMGASQTCGGQDAGGVTQRLTSGDVEGGVSASVLAKLDAFGSSKFKKECTLFAEHETLRYDRAYPSPGGAGATCKVAGPFPLPPSATANPAACFSSESPEGGEGGAGIIAGTCTHDVCVAGEKLGQQCDDCTMKVCAVDSYCCDTYWGLSCFDQVQKLCGKTCGP